MTSPKLEAQAEANLIRLLEGGPMYEGLLDGPGEADAVDRLAERGVIRRTYPMLGLLTKIELVKD